MSLYNGISLHQCASYCSRFKNCNQFGYQGNNINPSSNDICTIYAISFWCGNVIFFIYAAIVLISFEMNTKIIINYTNLYQR